MKTYQLLLITLLLTNRITQAQDFRAVPPLEQPNAAELAYFVGKNPAVSGIGVADSACVRLVGSFLHNLTDSQLEAGYQQLAGGFAAFGPGYNDKLDTDNMLAQWDRDGTMFADQHLTVESSLVTTVATGNNRGTRGSI